LKQQQYAAPENIHTHLIISHKKSLGGVGAVKARYFTGMYQARG